MLDGYNYGNVLLVIEKIIWVLMNVQGVKLNDKKLDILSNMK
jgi:hypothetical protein